MQEDDKIRIKLKYLVHYILLLIAYINNYYKIYKILKERNYKYLKYIKY